MKKENEKISEKSRKEETKKARKKKIKMMNKESNKWSKIETSWCECIHHAKMKSRYLKYCDNFSTINTGERWNSVVFVHAENSSHPMESNLGVDEWSQDKNSEENRHKVKRKISFNNARPQNKSKFFGFKKHFDVVKL